MPRLIITKGPDQGTDFSIGDEPVTFGRLANCEVTLNDTKVSRAHARIEARDGTHEITDLGSANGTLVNGRPIKAQRLYGGDVITIGTSDIRFQADAARASRQLTSAASGTPTAPGEATFRPEDIQVKNEPLQFSKHKGTESASFLRSDVLQEGGPLRWLLILAAFVVLAGVAIGTAWLMKNVLLRLHARRAHDSRVRGSKDYGSSEQPSSVPAGVTTS